MARIFLSHASKDDLAAVAIRSWLSEAGWDDVFLDLDPEAGFTPGERWERALSEHAARSEAVVLLVSQSWLDSSRCRQEYELARRLSKRIFVVILDRFTPQDLPGYLTDTHQVVSLGSGADHREFRVERPVTHEEGSVTFSTEGLARLKSALTQAGLNPRFFSLPPASALHRDPYRGLAPRDPETGTPRWYTAPAAQIPAEARPLIDLLVEQRLLTRAVDPETGEVMLRPAHEELLRQWGNLRGRLEEDLARLVALEGVKRAARDWDAKGRDVAAAAHDGARLDEAGRLDTRPDLAALLDATDRAYLAACLEKQRRAQARVQARAAAQARGARRTRIGLAASIVLAVLAAGAATYGLNQAKVAGEQKAAAERLAVEARRQKEEAEQQGAQAQRQAVEAERQKAEAEFQRAQAQRQAVAAERQKAEAEQQRAQAQRQAVEAERQKMEAEEQRAQAQRQVVETELQKAEAEQRAQAQRQIVETELQRADAQRQAIETERRNAEAEHRRAEADRQIAEAVRQSRLATEREQEARRERDEARRQAEAAQLAQSRFLVDLARQRAGTQDHATTMLLALEALPDLASGTRRPYVGEAEGQLVDATAALRELLVLDGGRSRATFSPGGSSVLTNPGNVAVISNSATGETITTLSGHAAWIAEFNREGDRIMTVSGDEARLWDAKSGQALRSIRLACGANRVEFSPDGTGAALALACGNDVLIWNFSSQPETRLLQGHDYVVSTVSFSPDGKRLVTTSYSAPARIWDLETGRTTAVLTPPRGEGDLVAVFGPDSRQVLTRSERAVRLWHADAGQETAAHVSQSPLTSAAFSPDGQDVVIGSSRAVEIWHAATGRTSGLGASDDDQGIRSAAFSPDGRFVATASGRIVRIWDVRTREMPRALSGHDAAVLDVLFSPDGRRVLSTAADNTVRIWSVDPSDAAHRVAGHTARADTAEFSRGDRKVTGSNDRTVPIRRSDAETQQLVDEARKKLPRCLDRKQREAFFLQPEPPGWCIAQQKWPYHTQAWRQWLDHRRANPDVPRPDAPEGAEWTAQRGSN